MAARFDNRTCALTKALISGVGKRNLKAPDLALVDAVSRCSHAGTRARAVTAAAALSAWRVARVRAQKGMTPLDVAKGRSVPALVELLEKASGGGGAGTA